MDDRRYYGLDALRGSMMMLGIVIHSAGYYISMPPPHLPFIGDRNTSLSMDVLAHFIHSFRMPLFFVLAGFFASLLVEKRGLADTYRNRAARILAPLVAAMLTVLPVGLLFALDFIIAVRYGRQELIPDRAAVQRLTAEMEAMGAPRDLFMGHLWFLYYLLYFYLLMPFARWLQPRLRPIVTSPFAFVFFCVWTAVTLWPYAGGQVFGEFLFLKPNLPGLIYYGSFFVLGYVFHFNRDIVQVSMPRMRLYVWLAVVVFPLSMYASHLEYARGPSWHLLAIVLNTVSTWALIYVAVGLALRYFDRPSPWILYASQSAYWVYLLHLPVVCLVAWWLVPFDLPAEIKFGANLAITTFVCFVTYHYWVQRTWVSVFLNGKRFDLDWPWRKPAVTEAVTT